MNMRVARMRKTKTRKVHNASFKAKVALEAVRETKTLNEIGQEYGVHPVQVSHWKKALLEKASDLFEGKRGPLAVTDHSDWGAALQRNRAAQDGVGLVEKKVRSEPVAVRRPWISPEDPLPLVRQCAVAGVSRRPTTRINERNRWMRHMLMLRLIDEE